MLNRLLTFPSVPGRLLLVVLVLLLSANAIRPTQPIVVNPNTESSPSNVMFYFSL